MPDPVIFIFGLFTFLLLGGGLGFTVYEFRRMDRGTKKD